MIMMTETNSSYGELAPRHVFENTLYDESVSGNFSSSSPML